MACGRQAEHVTVALPSWSLLPAVGKNGGHLYTCEARRLPVPPAPLLLRSLCPQGRWSEDPEFLQRFASEAFHIEHYAKKRGLDVESVRQQLSIGCVQHLSTILGKAKPGLLLQSILRHSSTTAWQHGPVAGGPHGGGQGVEATEGPAASNSDAYAEHLRNILGWRPEPAQLRGTGLALPDIPAGAAAAAGAGGRPPTGARIWAEVARLANEDSALRALADDPTRTSPAWRQHILGRGVVIMPGLSVHGFR